MDTLIIPADRTTTPLVSQIRRADQNPALVYLASLPSQKSRETMRTALNQIVAIMANRTPPRRADYSTLGEYREAKADYDRWCEAFDWSTLRYQHTGAIRARLIADYSPATANKMLSALRGVLKEAWRLEQMSAEHYQRAVDLEGVKVNTAPAGRDLKQGEIMALADVCLKDVSAAGARDGAIIGLLYGTGLRRAELVSLQLSDFDQESGKITIRSGKGRKDRSVYAGNGTLDALIDWLNVRGDAPGALFLPIHKSGSVQCQAIESESGKPETLKGMTAQAVYNMLIRRGKEAKIKDFSPHDFRRTFAGDLLDRGVDIVTVAKLMGHANVETTGRYDRRPEEVKRQAAFKLHFPYQQRRKLD